MGWHLHLKVWNRQKRVHLATRRQGQGYAEQKFLIKVKNWKESSSQAKEYYTAMNKNTLLLPLTQWMELKTWSWGRRAGQNTHSVYVTFKNRQWQTLSWNDTYKGVMPQRKQTEWPSRKSGLWISLGGVREMQLEMNPQRKKYFLTRVVTRVFTFHYLFLLLCVTVTCIFYDFLYFNICFYLFIQLPWGLVTACRIFCCRAGGI